METRKGDWIVTFTGKKFYPLEPRIEDIDIKDIGHALSNLCRFAGHTPKFYSVAQHSVLVAAILQHLKCSDEVVLAGLLHDAPEAYLVDLPTPIKKQMQSYQEAEKTIEALIRRRFNLIYDEAIHYADMVALATEARDLMGNPQDWDSLKGIKPMEGYKIEPVAPFEAKKAFFSTLGTLFGTLVKGDQNGKA